MPGTTSPGDSVPGLSWFASAGPARTPSGLRSHCEPGPSRRTAGLSWSASASAGPGRRPSGLRSHCGPGPSRTTAGLSWSASAGPGRWKGRAVPGRRVGARRESQLYAHAARTRAGSAQSLPRSNVPPAAEGARPGSAFIPVVAGVLVPDSWLS